MAGPKPGERFTQDDWFAAASVEYDRLSPAERRRLDAEYEKRLSEVRRAAVIRDARGGDVGNSALLGAPFDD